MKLTIIGCGSIGRTLARYLETVDDVELVHVYDNKKEAVDTLVAECQKVRYATNLEDAFEKSDLIVETASQSAVHEYIPRALEMGKNVLVMSVGAFVEDDFKEKCRIIAKQKGCKVYIPSGAVCGIEGICAAAVEEVEEVIIMSYKPPEALRDVKYLKNKGIDIDAIKRPKVIFNGHAKDAVKHFPKNINVAATLSLAGVGIERTMVKIVIDPKATRNTHRIIAKGKFGEIECWSRNMPFPENPRTSYLAALSLISAVKKIMGSFWVGV
ncbi:MAG: aspartate dehydrogenase [Candidatus Thermoplasmatota archaeon]|nr:aspartate dehydrogenase [Euryarchaeota archaeon]MBU4071762.1 aspartate dehydrogenase [Candidatus Thermoplasmatota archaeon]MBU4144883.1 aspartate dehydrogenase [Candidatus Thermoplasmatota archaeon]MBU4592850.1 aspartate dehydrogenase [Candidatus Thermoplasmatota archaeon]